ncbi:MAG: hypothetical protein ABR970_07445 [Roseiarcus sp.]|jgi:hypothetical protein
MGREQLWPDLSVQISRRRWRCVPDPHLCLSYEGAAFVRGLTTHAEVWLAPEFLNILDNAPLYDQQPRLLTESLGGHHTPEEIRHALRIWLRLRNEAGHVGGPLCWVRDALRESCLPAGMEESIVPRWEAMAEALDERLPHTAEASGPGIAVTRDIAALAAVVPGAVLLSKREAAEPDQPPLLCRHLQTWRLPCRRLKVGDDLVALERNLLLHLLVEAGLAGFLWGGLGLAVVHLVVPDRFRVPAGHGFAGAGEELDLLAEGEPLQVKSAWEDAQAFWYDLPQEHGHGG